MENRLGIIDVMPESFDKKGIEEALHKKEVYDELTKEKPDYSIFNDIFKECFDELIYGMEK